MNKYSLGLHPKKFHFMGIGGSGMSAAANLAIENNFRISGCDLNIDTPYISSLKIKKVKIFEKHDKKHLGEHTKLVVSPAAFFQKPLHNELKTAKNAITWQKFLADYIMNGKKTICISGTHGKSTITAMTSLLFEKSKLDPSVMIGAKINKWNANYRNGKSNIFIVESDEFYDNFLNYSPNIIILNNIEYDHPDFFKSEKQMFKSFEKHIKSLKGEKILIYNSENKGIKKLFKLIKINKLKNINLISFSLKKEEVKYKDYFKNLLGDHNKSNALAVIKLAQYFNVSEKIIKNSLLNFKGIGRRMEKLESKKYIIYDDYAHHPTAIKATLKALRQKYPRKIIHAIVEPHSYSRTKAILKLYKNAFSNVDFVYLAPIFKARDTHKHGVSLQSIVNVSSHKNIFIFKNYKNLTKAVFKKANKSDVIIVMGAGNSYKIAKEIANIK